MFTTPPLGATINVGLGRVPCSRPKTPGRTSTSRRRARPGSDRREKSPAPFGGARPEFDDALKRFVVTREIPFRGNSVAVYAGNDRLLQQRYAGRSVKLLTADARRDLAAMKEYRHANIVPILRVSILAASDPGLHGSPDVILRLRSEHIAGTSIADLLRTRGAFSDEGVKVYARQICKGLKFLHNNGVAHRDLRCETVVLCEDGTVKLAGWAEGGTLTHHFPRSYDTPYFLPPEVLLDAPPASDDSNANANASGNGGGADGSKFQWAQWEPQCADTWSLGCVNARLFVLACHASGWYVQG